jgi:hypothetical protein
MSVGNTTQNIDVGGKGRAQESRYCADRVGGWVEGDGGIKAIFLARINGEEILEIL